MTISNVEGAGAPPPNPVQGESEESVKGPAEIREVSEELKSLDDTTVDPEDFIEHEMEYPEAEAIETALAETMSVVSPLDSLRDVVSESDVADGGASEPTGDGVYSKSRVLPVATNEGGEPAPGMGDLSGLGGPRTSDSEENEAATTEDASESYMLSSGEPDANSAIVSVMNMSNSDAEEEIEDLADKISDESSRKPEQPSMEDISIVAGLEIPEGNLLDSGESGSSTGSISGTGELDAVDDSVDPEKLASEEKAEEVAYQEEVRALEAELGEAQKQYDLAVATGNPEDADNLAKNIEALKDKLEDLHRSQGQSDSGTTTDDGKDDDTTKNVTSTSGSAPRPDAGGIPEED